MNRDDRPLFFAEEKERAWASERDEARRELAELRGRYAAWVRRALAREEGA